METKTILIVDDEESVLYVLRNSLLKVGHEYRILTALDGNSALKYFEKYQIDLVISDYRMTGMDGLELIGTISKVQPNTRMILITGFGTDEIEAEAQRLNVFAYMKKPIDLNLLRQTVRHALGEVAPSQPGEKVSKSSIVMYLRQLIEQLQREVNASCVLLVNVEEKENIASGQDEALPSEQLTSYFNTALAMAEKANEFLDDEAGAETWLIRRGARVNIYAGRVDNKHLLIILADAESQLSIRSKLIDTILASVEDIRNVLTYSITKSIKENPFDTGFNQAVQTELDKLFTADFEEEDNSLSNQTVFENTFTMSYEEALSLGLILPTKEHNNSENH